MGANATDWCFNNFDVRWVVAWTFMAEKDPAITIHRSAVESMTVEAMVLIDEVETYFANSDEITNTWSSNAQLSFKQSGLLISTRLTELVDWMVRHTNQVDLTLERFSLSEGDANPVDLPPRARALIAAARSLFARVDALSDTQQGLVSVQSPARLLQDRVERSFSREERDI